MLDKKVGFFLLSCHTPPLLFKSVFTSPLSLLAFCEEQFLIARLFFICLPLITKRRKHVKWQTWQTLKTWIAYICKRIMALQNLKVMLPKHGSALANNGTANHRKAPALAGITPQQHITNTSDLLFAWVSVLKSKDCTCIHTCMHLSTYTKAARNQINL